MQQSHHYHAVNKTFVVEFYLRRNKHVFVFPNSQNIKAAADPERSFKRIKVFRYLK